MTKVSVVTMEVHYSNLPSKEPAGRKVVGRLPQLLLHPHSLLTQRPAPSKSVAPLTTKHYKDTEPA